MCTFKGMFSLTQKLCVFIVGITAFATKCVSTTPIVMAMDGPDAALTCELIGRKNVLQVTWQKITSSSAESVATCSQRFGSKVLPPFQQSVKLSHYGLQNSTLLIQGVGKKQEACYRCLFNVFPEGAISSTTCLKVYERYEPTIETNDLMSSDHTLCSAKCPLANRNSVEHLDREVGSEGRVEPGSTSLTVIEASASHDSIRTRGFINCGQHLPTPPSTTNVFLEIGGVQMRLHGNGGLSLKSSLSFVIFVTGLCIHSVMNLFH